MAGVGSSYAGLPNTVCCVLREDGEELLTNAAGRKSQAHATRNVFSMPFLEFDGTSRELSRGDTVVGSGSQAAWRVQDAGLAARHFTITTDQAGLAKLVPVSTQSVVVVNGRQLGAAGVALHDGDRISAGDAHFVYTQRQGGVPSRTPDCADPVRAFLVAVDEPVAYPVRRRTTSIGRDAASHIIVPDPTVSRFHADVRSEAGQHVLYSMGSAGTTVNGIRVAGPQLLEEGDEVTLGGAAFRYTRAAVPSDVRVQECSDADPSAAVRPTLVMQSAVTVEMPIVVTRKQPPLAVLIGLATIVLALVVIFVL